MFALVAKAVCLLLKQHRCVRNRPDETSSEQIPCRYQRIEESTA